MKYTLRRNLIRLTCAVAVITALASCGTVKFYTQAVSGQAQIWWRSKPIPSVLSTTTDAKLKTRLQLVQQMRDFAAKELQLPADKSFHHYADLGRDCVVWVVFAAPEFSTEGKSWWYPIVGSLKYRGFFDKTAAKKLGETLKSDGLDVVVGGTEAYSTLGWFADPVLNTFLHRDPPELAELIFHELTHIKLFIPGDTDFNEAMATAVGQEGSRRWLRSQGKTAELAQYENALAKDHEIMRLLEKKRTELTKLYAANRSLPIEQQRQAKAAAMASLQDDYQVIRQRWGGDSRYDRFFKVPMNNARLSNLSSYYQLVPAFNRLLKACDGDLGKFYQQVASFKSLSQSERRKRLLD